MVGLLGTALDALGAALGASAAEGRWLHVRRGPAERVDDRRRGPVLVGDFFADPGTAVDDFPHLSGRAVTRGHFSLLPGRPVLLPPIGLVKIRASQFGAEPSVRLSVIAGEFAGLLDKHRPGGKRLEFNQSLDELVVPAQVIAALAGPASRIEQVERPPVLR